MYSPCAIPRVFSIFVASLSIFICLSASWELINPASVAASSTSMAPTVLSPSPAPPCVSIARVFADICACSIASFRSSPIIILAQVPTTPIKLGWNISSVFCSRSISFWLAPNMKSFSDIDVVSTLTPSFSSSLPVLKQHPCGPCIIITSVFRSLRVYIDPAMGLGLGCIFLLFNTSL